MKALINAAVVRDARRLLRDASDLIATEKTWTHDVFARDRKGRSVMPGNKRPKPVAWCLFGAVLEADHRASATTPTSEQGAGRKQHATTLQPLDAALIALYVASKPILPLEMVDELEELVQKSVGMGPVSLDDPPTLVPLGYWIFAVNDLTYMTHGRILEILEDADRVLAELAPPRRSKQLDTARSDATATATANEDTKP